LEIAPSVLWEKWCLGCNEGPIGIGAGIGAWMFLKKKRKEEEINS